VGIEETSEYMINLLDAVAVLLLGPVVCSHEKTTINANRENTKSHRGVPNVWNLHVLGRLSFAHSVPLFFLMTRSGGITTNQGDKRA
jgi:hypothetical protein